VLSGASAPPAFPLECGADAAAGVSGKKSVAFKELLDSWRESAAVPLTAATYAVRLPVDDAARLAALAELFPGRLPEQLISELLAAALKEVAAAMPYVAGKRVISTDEQGDPLYEDVGLTPRFMELARLHRRSLEAQRQRAAPRPGSPARAPRARGAARKTRKRR
jgi:hypothetical protein